MKPRHPFHVPRLTWRCVSGLDDGVSELTKAVCGIGRTYYQVAPLVELEPSGESERGGKKKEQKGQFVQKSNMVERRGPSD